MGVKLFSPECLVESGEEEWPLDTSILDYLLLDTIPVHMTTHIGKQYNKENQ